MDHPRTSPRRSRGLSLARAAVRRSGRGVRLRADRSGRAEATKTGATPYDIKDVELGHHGPECSFDAFVHKYELDKDPAMAYMARVIRGADTADKTVTPESVGVEALLDGIRLVHYPDDQAQRKASIPVLDALYAYCKEKVAKK